MLKEIVVIVIAAVKEASAAAVAAVEVVAEAPAVNVADPEVPVARAVVVVQLHP